MPAEQVTTKMVDDIAIITMNRPPANAITYEFASEMTAAFDETEASGAGAIVLTGTGSFFSGGLDLRAIPSYGPQRQREFLTLVNSLIGRLYAFPKPVVAAVNGHAVAGAFVLVLTTDYRVGPLRDARFGLTEARAGIPFPGAPTIVVKAELSPADIRYATLYARNFGPDEARMRGVLDELQEPEKLLPRAMEVAHDLAAMPADSYARIKYQFRDEAIKAIEKMNRDQSDPMLRSWVSQDAVEASSGILSGK
ncbi:MAG: enoyl-CoA hydratase/isomerase family protein [bacterium]|nr:enoyl-CoA hydratase/isomerase family protein [bacterium]